MAKQARTSQGRWNLRQIFRQGDSLAESTSKEKFPSKAEMVFVSFILQT